MTTFPLPRPDGHVPTEEESADIKSALDVADARTTAAIAASYPLEWDEWCDEFARGDRPWVPSTPKKESL